MTLTCSMLLLLVARLQTVIRTIGLAKISCAVMRKTAEADSGINLTTAHKNATKHHDSQLQLVSDQQV